MLIQKLIVKCEILCKSTYSHMSIHISGDITVLVPYGNQYLFKAPNPTILDIVRSPEFVQTLNTELNNIGYALVNIQIMPPQDFAMIIYAISQYPSSMQELTDTIGIPSAYTFTTELGNTVHGYIQLRPLTS